VGVERIFPLHTSRIEKIEIVQRGRVRRARLNYLRNLQGRAARIKGERSVVDQGEGGRAAAENTAPATDGNAPSA